tara:strand:+ start:247 stop:528 length:282 start_codon:yes stop_codon:yes gene_type:complete
MTAFVGFPHLAHSWHSEATEMATIRKRGGRYHAQIRKSGYASLTKTFSSLSTARRWASATEADMERNLYAPPVEAILGDLLDRYEKEVSPPLI